MVIQDVARSMLTVDSQEAQACVRICVWGSSFGLALEHARFQWKCACMHSKSCLLAMQDAHMQGACVRAHVVRLSPCMRFGPVMVGTQVSTRIDICGV